MQGVGDKAGDPVLPRAGCQVLEQQGADAASLVLVADHEGDLGLVAAGRAVVPADRDDPLVELDDECLAVGMVDAGEVLDLPLRQVRMGGEEAQVDALRAQPLVEGDQGGAVIGPDRPDVAGAAVGEDGVGAPAARAGAVGQRGVGGRGGRGQPGHVELPSIPVPRGARAAPAPRHRGCAPCREQGAKVTAIPALRP